MFLWKNEKSLWIHPEEVALALLVGVFWQKGVQFIRIVVVLTLYSSSLSLLG